MRARRLLLRAGRDAAGLFLAEGPQAVREAVATGRARTLFATADAERRHPAVVSLARAAGLPVHAVDERAAAALSETVTPQGLVAVCGALHMSVATAFAPAPTLGVMMVEDRDPGNVGTVIRTSHAAGAGVVVLSEGCADVYNGKAVRASAGSLFHVPVVRDADPAGVVAEARSAGFAVLAACGDGEASLPALAGSGGLARPTLWMLGNEAHGLSAPVAALADRRVAIPLAAGAESLNVAAAAAVCLFTTAFAQHGPGRDRGDGDG